MYEGFVQAEVSVGVGVHCGKTTSAGDHHFGLMGRAMVFAAWNVVVVVAVT